MKLKKVTLHGFKSFADKVTFDLDCNIIGLVGPNGCGKSNIVDAIRWVMGEQSAKSLRGDKMHDVLFAGSDQRKPLNYAEVTITFTEINGELPLPYEEVTLARRLFRSGESEYYLNRELVRLKDIHNLFLGSGVGKSAFSIFEQGKLDQLIYWTPLERRAIFDEAAGTSRFLLRKKETLQKLTLVNENFTRLHDLHSEIEKQAKQLKKQAAQAKNYQENKAKLEGLEKNVLLYRWDEAAQKESATKEKALPVKQSLKEKQEEIHLLENHREKELRSVAAEEVCSRQKRQECNQQETKMRLLESQLTQHKQRLLEIKKREESTKKALATLTTEQQQRELEIQRKEELLQRLMVESSSTIDLKENLKKMREEHFKKMQEESRLNGELKEKSFHFEAKSKRLHALKSFEASHAALTQKNEAERIQQKERVSLLSSEIDHFKIELKQLDTENQLKRKQLIELQQEEQKIQRQLTETESHQKTLLRLKEEMEGFSTGAKLLLKEAANEKSPFFKQIEPLFEALTPCKGYEEVVAAAMKTYADTLVVSSEEVFEELLAFAKRKKISDFSIIVKTGVPPLKDALTSHSLALHLVDPQAIAFHFTQAFELTDKEGFYDSLGVFFHVNSGKKLNNSFHRQAELKTLSELLGVLQQTAAEQGSQREKSSELLKHAEKKRQEIDELRRKKEMDLIGANFELQQTLSEQEKLNKELLRCQQEKESFTYLEEEQAELERLKESAKGLKEEMVTLFERLKKEEALFERWQESRQQVEIFKAKQQQSLVHEKKMHEEVAELQERIEETLKTIIHQEKELEQAQRLWKELQQEAGEQEKRWNGLKKQCETQDKELLHKRKAVTLLEKEEHAVEVRLAQLLSEKTALEQELFLRHALKQEELVHHPREFTGTIESSLKEIGQLRTLLENSGAVNLAAIEEFRETQERFDHIDQQLKDVEESKKDLEEILLKLDQESRKLFKKTFQQIRETFQKNFSILFNGGSADLTFTEGSDLLEAGIEIVAKPPGKQLKAISLLSGGEKCLTALALLFSFFEVRPAPFCILDEVDAPLDETNIDRFTQLLKQFIDKTQFLIVTHNKKTMAIADLLIGISMEEKGVSKLIPLAFAKRAAHAVV